VNLFNVPSMVEIEFKMRELAESVRRLSAQVTAVANQSSMIHVDDGNETAVENIQALLSVAETLANSNRAVADWLVDAMESRANAIATAEQERQRAS